MAVTRKNKMLRRQTLTFLRILKLLKLSFTVLLHHQAMILLDKFPFL